jgi:hypothetical protein
MGGVGRGEGLFVRRKAIRRRKLQMISIWLCVFVGGACACVSVDNISHLTVRLQSWVMRIKCGASDFKTLRKVIQPISLQYGTVSSGTVLLFHCHLTLILSRQSVLIRGVSLQIIQKYQAEISSLL